MGLHLMKDWDTTNCTHFGEVGKLLFELPLLQNRQDAFIKSINFTVTFV